VRPLFRLLPKWRRLRRLQRLFHPDTIVENFLGMERLFNAAEVPAAAAPSPLPSEPRPLPEAFMADGDRFVTDDFLIATRTTGLLVLDDGLVTHESYALGLSAESRHVAWSISKSIVSTLFGIALDEGVIDGIDDPVEKYLPRQTGTGYEGVALKHVLQMSSGIRFVEDIDRWNSDLNRLGRWVAFGRPLTTFPTRLSREFDPGTYHRYASIDAQILALVLIAATGRSLTAYTAERLWTRIGTETPAYWLLDDHGTEFALGGFGATVRDFARFGQLYLNSGTWHGEQIVPAAWVRESVTPDAAHLFPGTRENSDHELGYGYQWWVPAGGEGEFLAIGAYNQFIYVNPERRVVVVKTSANHHYTMESASRFEAQSLELFRAIAAAASGAGSGKAAESTELG